MFVCVYVCLCVFWYIFMCDCMYLCVREVYVCGGMFREIFVGGRLLFSMIMEFDFWL